MFREGRASKTKTSDIYIMPGQLQSGICRLNSRVNLSEGGLHPDYVLIARTRNAETESLACFIDQQRVSFGCATIDADYITHWLISIVQADCC